MEIPGSGQGDSNGERLAAVFGAEQKCQSWTARRILFGRIVIFLSLPMAYLLLRGVGINSAESRFVLALWILALACLLGSSVAGWRAERLVQASLGGRTNDHDRRLKRLLPLPSAARARGRRFGRCS